MKIVSLNLNHNKYLLLTGEMTGVYFAVGTRQNGELFTAARYETWMGRSRYATIVKGGLWIFTKEVVFHATGKASGGGYCKSAAAFKEALGNCGIKMDTEFTNEDSIREALEVIAIEICKARSVLVVSR